jgi:hypothetical protein
MDEALQKAIELIESQLKPIEEQANAKKRLINQLCEAGGEEPRYPNAEPVGAASFSTKIRGDQFFGHPLATSVKWILERRKASGKSSIALVELCDILELGGYDFDNKDKVVARRNVAITLSKNPAFMKVPANGEIGLAEWYPNAKKAKPKTSQEMVEEYSEEVLSETAEKPEENPFGDEKAEGATGG